MRRIAVYPAARWNALCQLLRRAWPLEGTNARLALRGGEHSIEGRITQGWRHPWKLRLSYEYYENSDGTETGEWRARVTPGFVNGRDAFISMKANWQPNAPAADVPLTDLPGPWLSVVGFRDPAASSGATTDDAGDIIYGAAEGYPALFNTLGVVPPAPGGETQDAQPIEGRTRQIRASDVWINTPRPASSLDVESADAVTDAETDSISATFNLDHFNSVGGRSILQTADQFAPITDSTIDSPLLDLPMMTGDSGIDQRLMATVYFVSPPDLASDAMPDETWQAFPNHFTFWNLWHAVKFTPPAPQQPPIEFGATGLGVGTLDYLSNAMLAANNSEQDEIQAYLSNADMRGIFWTG